MSIRYFAIVALALVSVLAGCKEEEKAPSCVDTLCEPGTSFCAEGGIYIASCSDDGRGISFEKCGVGFHCDTGSCVANACRPDETKCVEVGGVVEVQVCDSVGTAFEPDGSCSDGSMCVGGLCLETPCAPNSKQCGTYGILTCYKFDEWIETACDPGEYCLEDADGVPACVALGSQSVDCDPGERVCLPNENTVAICGSFGDSFVEKSCPKGTECLAGFCLETLCEGETTVDVAGPADTAGGDTTQEVAIEETAEEIALDTVVEDTGPEFVLEPLDTATVTIDGTEIEFEDYVSGTYVPGIDGTEKLLQVGMNQNVSGQSYKMEVHFQPIEEYTVGPFDSETGGSVAVTILFNDGTLEPGGEIQWKYISETYEAELTEFGPAGGRIKGTFSGVLADQTGGGASVTITNGTFDVKRKN